MTNSETTGSTPRDITRGCAAMLRGSIGCVSTLDPT